MQASEAVHLGDGLYKPSPNEVSGEYVDRDGELWYKINNFDDMPPFFISVVSPTNFWLFISTNGGLTCGRVNKEKALFPYYTVDKVHDSKTTTGPCTILQVTRGGKTSIWQPFTEPRLYTTTRSLYKTVSGDRLEFEECNHDLGLQYSYSWSTANEFGFIRRCSLTNTSGQEVSIRILDGMQNVLPAGVNPFMQDIKSVLVDAYKWTEVDPASQVGIFCLYALPWDRAEPKESLQANVVYHRGLPDPTIVLSTSQLDDFRAGHAVKAETVVRGRRGAYFVESQFTLTGNQVKNWVFVADVQQNHKTIAQLKKTLSTTSTDEYLAKLAAGEAKSSSDLKKIVAAADGLQCTECTSTTAHHFANVLFNIMRGGIFDSNYDIHRDDFTDFLKKWNAPVAAQHAEWLTALPEITSFVELIPKVRELNSSDLLRLALEYLPITFSRRHGDPSRPWNQFSINLQTPKGEKILSYQGNWRDIFQNWEALCLSYPNFYPSMIAKFVNASTADGFNPYRVSRDGVDWEVTDPHDPWAFIGYWGDHQIIYLLKFLEWTNRFSPESLASWMHEEIFAYANVPYIIRPYEEVVSNPKDTIVFDHDRHKQILESVAKMGSDAKLHLDSQGKVVHVNLMEKLLVTTLSKLCNFVLDGGIWLNTQRPEWNDANNALVGNGVSMVTTYYIRRWLTFFLEEMDKLPADFQISSEVQAWFAGTKEVYMNHETMLEDRITVQQRRVMLDALGGVFSKYRSGIYEKGFSGAKATIAKTDIVAFFKSALLFINHTIKANKLDSGLYHSYNILVLGKGTADINHLYDMLEGQVCALSSGTIKGAEVVAMLDKMRASPLYREDQSSFILYPDRQLPSFMARNAIPAERMNLPGMQFVLSNKLEQIAYVDCEGVGRFADDLHNADDLLLHLDKISALAVHQQELVDTHELVFNHKAFTGRSGTMFSFEGLGCIYWHMCSKLLLATQEACQDAIDTTDFKALADKYYEIREGLGFNKTPQCYGAFPADPYSHTPSHAGAQQPGMTGQVKEEVITRFGELGVMISAGTVKFLPKLLRKSELLTSIKAFNYVNVRGEWKTLNLGKGQLGFTYCQVPIVYTAAAAYSITVKSSNGQVQTEGNVLSKLHSDALFHRTGEVECIEVAVPEAEFL
jgi:hypothetical protein|uniref:Uncharacterized protein n=1 Tax=Eutreptiella gymnastica TaxID=73025 RepID=A0A7S4D3M1_9EUGL